MRRGALVLSLVGGCGERARVVDDAAVWRDATPADTAGDGAQPMPDAGLSDAAVDAASSNVDAAPDARVPMIVAVACPASPTAIVVTQGQAFSPQQSTISVGQIVRFEPTSSHDVVSGTQSAPTPSWFQVDGGLVRCFRFDEAGTFAFFCSIHANMTGAVVVTP